MAVFGALLNAQVGFLHIVQFLINEFQRALLNVQVKSLMVLFILLVE